MSNHGTKTKNEYWMPSHTRACVTATGAVLLDLKRNRYFGLGAREARSLAALALNWSQASTQAGPILEPMAPQDAARLANALIEAGFLTPTAPCDEPVEFRPIRADEPVSCAEYELRSPGALQVRHLVAFVCACIWARRAVESRLLYSVACEVSRHKREVVGAVDLQQVIELVAVFRRLRPYAFAAKDQCLFHALALLKFLVCYRIFPTWVIAVRPLPWAAHSWLQLGNVVLDCNPEEISGFSPIMAI